MATTDKIVLKFHNHKRNIVGNCLMKHREGVECDKISNYNCASCGWCYEVEAKRKEAIRRKLENCS